CDYELLATQRAMGRQENRVGACCDYEFLARLEVDADEDGLGVQLDAVLGRDSRADEPGEGRDLLCPCAAPIRDREGVLRRERRARSGQPEALREPRMFDEPRGADLHEPAGLARGRDDAVPGLEVEHLRGVVL